MINMALGLAQDQSGLIFYKFSVMPEFQITPTPTPTVTPTPTPAFLNPGGGYVADEKVEEYWRKYKFSTIIGKLEANKEFNIKFPLPELKLINIKINEKKHSKIKSDDK